MSYFSAAIHHQSGSGIEGLARTLSSITLDLLSSPADLLANCCMASLTCTTTPGWLRNMHAEKNVLTGVPFGWRLQTAQHGAESRAEEHMGQKTAHIR